MMVNGCFDLVPGQAQIFHRQVFKILFSSSDFQYASYAVLGRHLYKIIDGNDELLEIYEMWHGIRRTKSTLNGFCQAYPFNDKHCEGVLAHCEEEKFRVPVLGRFLIV